MLHLSDLNTPTVVVTQEYLHNLNLTIKHLTRLLKVRLRAEFPDSYSILNELNEKLIPVI